MPTTRSTRKSFSRRPTAAVLVAALFLLTPAASHAHFRLDEPACYSIQDSFGGPQKSAPCGQADPGQPLRSTGAVTAYVQGQMITISINEMIFHPGHYRISIAQDIASLPPDPVVRTGTTACGSTDIEPNPTLPLIADGVFLHTRAFTGPQTIEIPLPPDFTCTNCILQVTEFMSNHALNNPGGCFYHHCATITVAAPEDAGAMPNDSAAMGDSGADAGDASTTRMPPRGCGCGIPQPRASGRGLAALALLAIVSFQFRRRRVR